MLANIIFYGTVAVAVIVIAWGIYTSRDEYEDRNTHHRGRQ